MKFKICKNKEAYIGRKGNSIAGYHIQFKNKLGPWCKYRRIPDWSPAPGTPFVVTYISRESAERVMTELQNGTKCNKGVSMVMVTVIAVTAATTFALWIVTLCNGG